MKPKTPSNHVGQTRKGPDSGRSPYRGNRGGVRAHSRPFLNWHVIIGWGIGPAVWLVIALAVFFCCSSCEKGKRDLRQELKGTHRDSLIACAPVDAPRIHGVHRFRSRLLIIGDITTNVELSDTTSEYVFLDCSRFTNWDCKEYPFQFYRNIRGAECEEYIVYYGKRINVK